MQEWIEGGPGSSFAPLSSASVTVIALSAEELKMLASAPGTTAAERRAAFARLYTLDPAAAATLADRLLWSNVFSIDARAVVATAIADSLSAGDELPASLRSLAIDVETDWKLRLPALSALVSSRPSEARPYVEVLAQSSDPATVGRAVDVLVAARDPSYVPLLTRTINQPSARSHVARLAGSLADLKDRSWSVVQLTGEPDLPIAGDLGTAWASKSPDMGDVTIVVTYAIAVTPAQLRLHETHNPGALARIDAQLPSGAWERLWEGKAGAGTAPLWFEPLLDRVSVTTRTLRLTMDTNRVVGWNEIDAVQLIGTDGSRQWVQSARASSSYAD